MLSGDVAYALRTLAIAGRISRGCAVECLERRGVYADRIQQVADVALSGRRNQLREGELRRIVADCPGAELPTSRMTSADEGILERAGSLKAPTECGMKREVARRPHPREGERD